MLTPRSDDKNRDRELMRKSENPDSFGAKAVYDVNEKLRETHSTLAADKKNAQALEAALNKKEEESKAAASGKGKAKKDDLDDL